MAKRRFGVSSSVTCDASAGGVDFRWNQVPASIGIACRLAPEYADDGVGDRLTGTHPRFADAFTGW